MRPRISGPVTGLFLSLAALAPTAALAGLAREGPTSTVHGFPEWYQDKTGLILDFCSPVNDLELQGGWCLLLPPVPATAPEVFPTNFSDEHFYWAAGATTTAVVNGQVVTAIFTFALEGAFAQGPVVAGDQLVFGRVRMVLSPVPVTGDYTVYTPFGTLFINGQVADPAGRIFFTEDIGVACAQGRFDCALASAIGPFLLPSPSPGGPELPPVPLLDPATGCTADGLTCDPFWPFGGTTTYPATGRKYVTDPSRLGPVTGSPFPPFVSPIDGLTRDHNMVRIEVTPADGSPRLLAGETTDFTLMGRVFEGVVAGRVTLDRASYARPAPTTTGNKVDVFATALPTARGRVPPATAPLPDQPQLVFYDAPCGVDPTTGALTAPIDPATNLPYPAHAMTSALGWKYVVGQSAPAAIPPSVCVEQTNGFDVNGNAISLFAQAPVTDQIFLSAADFDPNAGTLTVMASSSDRSFPPVLTVAGLGTVDNFTGTLVAPRAAPPNRVTVISSAGGLNQRLVKSAFFVASPINAIVANADAYPLAEDDPATVLAVQANDTMGGSAMPAGAITTLVTTPLLGTAVVNLDGTVTYTPNANAFGTDQFSYTVTLNGVTSNSAAVTITIAPVNDVPVAADDNFAATVNPTTPTAITLNVLANDTDPDGPGDLFAAVNLVPVSAPAGAVWSVTGGAGGAVSFTANVAGAYTFTYQAQDKGGGVVPAVPALSNVATATVNASGETVTITGAEYIVKKLRWKVTGTASPSAGQTITITFANGPNAGALIGTAPVIAGTWTYDFAPASGTAIPATGATAITATGPGGGTATATFRLK